MLKGTNQCVFFKIKNDVVSLIERLHLLVHAHRFKMTSWQHSVQTSANQ